MSYFSQLPSFRVGLFFSFFSAALVAFLYAPIIAHYFTADDFINLSRAAKCGFDLHCFLSPVARYHWSPLLKVFWTIEWSIFGNKSELYYVVNILLHIAVSILAGFLFAKAFNKNWILPFFVLVFGLSYAHWRVPMWITTQGQMLAALFLVVSLLLLYFWFKSKNVMYYLAALGAHFSAMLFFTTGILFFVVTTFFLLTFRRTTEHHYNFAFAFWSSVPFIVNATLYIFIRGIFVESNFDSLMEQRGVAGTLIEAAGFFVGGFAHGFAGHYTGIGFVITKIFGFPWSWVNVLTALCVGFLIFVPIEKIRHRDKFSVFLCVGLLISASVLYLLPIVPRLDWGYNWFVTRARYCYVPGIFVAAAFCIRIGELCATARRKKSRITLALVTSFVVCVLLVNSIALLLKEQQRFQDSNLFRRESENFIEQVKILIRQNKEFCIVDSKFSETEAGWNAKPTNLLAIYEVKLRKDRTHIIHKKEEKEKCKISNFVVLPNNIVVE